MFNQKFVLGVLGRELQICLIDEDEELAVVGVLLLHVLVNIDEHFERVEGVSLGIDHIDKCIGILQDHLLTRCGVIKIILGGKIIRFEL